MIGDVIDADRVVTDLTDPNPNAFYGLGVRHSTEKPTIHVARGTALPTGEASSRAGGVSWSRRELSSLPIAKSAIPSLRLTLPSRCGNARTRELSSQTWPMKSRRSKL